MGYNTIKDADKDKNKNKNTPIMLFIINRVKIKQFDI